VALTAVGGDVYLGEYTFTPNAHCGKIRMVVEYLGNFNDAILYWSGGNIVSVIEDNNPVVAVGRPLVYKFKTGDPRADIELEAFAMLYDNDGRYAGLQRFEFVNQEYNDALPTPGTVAVSITNITSTGATYTFTPEGDNVMGFMFDTIDADWYDNLVATDPGLDPNYIRDRFQQQGYNFFHKSENTPWTEEAATPGKRYYVGVCPMNANGFSDPDWGALTLSDPYTTLQ
jgi:hypothetical protein